MSEAKKAYYDVFSIREYTQERQVKTSWIRLGMAFVNKDGSFNLRLHALPLTDLQTGTANLHMRLHEERDEAGADQENQADAPVCDDQEAL